MCHDDLLLAAAPRLGPVSAVIAAGGKISLPFPQVIRISAKLNAGSLTSLTTILQGE